MLDFCFRHPVGASGWLAEAYRGKLFEKLGPELFDSVVSIIGASVHIMQVYEGWGVRVLRPIVPPAHFPPAPPPFGPPAAPPAAAAPHPAGPAAPGAPPPPPPPHRHDGSGEDSDIDLEGVRASDFFLLISHCYALIFVCRNRGGARCSGGT